MAELTELTAQVAVISRYAPYLGTSTQTSLADDRALLYAIAEAVKTLATAAADHETRITTLEGA